VIRVPGDKSVSHRALLLAALARGESRLSGLLPGEDCRSTAACLRALGVEIPPLPADGSEIRIRSLGLSGLTTPPTPLDCGNSGTTARLLMGVLAGLPLSAVLTGDASLRSRPMRRVTEPLGRMGAAFREEGEPDRLPIRVTGRAAGGALRSLDWSSPVASAQVKSALLLAGLTGGVPVTCWSRDASRDHTERMLRLLGVEVTEGWEPGEGPSGQDGGGEAGGRRWRVALEPFQGPLPPLDLQVPGDFSSAVFLLALGLLGGAGPRGLQVGGVGLNPTRASLLPVLLRMGAHLEVRMEPTESAPGVGEPVGEVRAHPSELRGTEVGGDEIPGLIDEIPVLAALAVRARGVTRIRDARELRVKESDRITALVTNLRALGVEVEEFPDGLAVHGTDRPLQGAVRTFHDHRIAMAFGILGALPGNRIEVEAPEVVEVSFPGFWALLAERTGGGGASPSGRPSPPRSPSPRRPIVTVDGPAGSGKSSTASAVARALGFRHLDSGALYRGLTLALLRSGVPAEGWGDLTEADLARLDIRLETRGDDFRILLDGEDPGDALRSEAVTSRVSRAARVPAVRARLLELAAAGGQEGGIVTDGRDMGTVVFPGAEVKVFLVADLEERARRRLLQEGREPTPPAVAAEAQRLRERDRVDEERETAPLRRPEGARVVDTTHLSFEEQVARIVGMVEP
jgi:3-phosphoshikimate 1-carboxyvinyltransferase